MINKSWKEMEVEEMKRFGLWSWEGFSIMPVECGSGVLVELRGPGCLGWEVRFKSSWEYWSAWEQR